MSRENSNNIFIGTNKSGKTTIAELMARHWRRCRPKNHLLITYDPTHRIDDIADILIDPEDEDWAVRLCYVRNAFIWLDETRALNEKNTPAKGLKRVLQMHTNWNIDFVSIFHNPEVVLNCFTFHEPTYFIFKTSAKEGSFQRKIPNALLCITAANQVNEYIYKYNIDLRKAYPRLPYAEVRTSEKRIISHNMSKLKYSR